MSQETTRQYVVELYKNELASVRAIYDHLSKDYPSKVAAILTQITIDLGKEF